MGTVGYVVLEGWPIIDAFYMTVITISTVGFGEIRAISNTGRLFTAVLIVSGVGAAAYTFSSVADYIVAGELRGVLRRQRMENRIRKLGYFKEIITQKVSVGEDGSGQSIFPGQEDVRNAAQAKP